MRGRIIPRPLFYKDEFMPTKPQPFTILCDSREQLPYAFRAFPEVTTKKATLKTGDYSLENYESEITIERKNPADFLGSITRGRDRFEREIQRMVEIPCRGVVIECELQNLLNLAMSNTMININSIIGTLASWNQKYNITFWMLPNRQFAESFVYRYFSNFLRIKSEQEKTTN